MLTDITKLTQHLFNQGFQKQKVLSLYKIFDNLYEMINSIYLVANHYLALRFDENFLVETTNFNSGIEKWRYFLNEDLKILQKSIRKHLISLQTLKESESYPKIYRIFKPLKYVYLIDLYEIKVENFELKFKQIDINLDYETNRDTIKSISLKTLEDREKLKYHLFSQMKLLEDEMDKLRNFISNNFTIDDILYSYLSLKDCITDEYNLYLNKNKYSFKFKYNNQEFKGYFWAKDGEFQTDELLFKGELFKPINLYFEKYKKALTFLNRNKSYFVGDVIDSNFQNLTNKVINKVISEFYKNNSKLKSIYQKISMKKNNLKKLLKTTNLPFKEYQKKVYFLNKRKQKIKSIFEDGYYLDEVSEFELKKVKL